ncbi:MAG: MCE family protein [Rhodobacteraceae bacterium]|nr:MCE family protein [Paracoccaceae bacterium]
MSEGRHEWKVGVFVVFALALLAALILSFSKGLSPLRATYEILLRTSDVGGIKSRAGVLMAGVQVGNVTGIELAPDGRSVVLRLRIEERYQIHRDAQFLIEQSGLLGDQFVAIVPRQNAGAILRDGDQVETAPSPDFKEMLRSGAGLIGRLDDLAATLQETAGRINESLLSEENVAALSTTVTNLQAITGQAGDTLDRVDRLVTDNTEGISAAVVDLRDFSREVKLLAADLRHGVATNAGGVGRAVNNIETASAAAVDLLAGLKDGDGLLGGLLRDDSLKEEVGALISNLTATSSNLVILSSNLSHHGIFYKPRKTPLPPVETIYPGRTSYK